MKSTATTPDEYIASLKEDRQAIITSIRNVLLKKLPKGFKEGIGYGMLSYSVPHSMYPNGYHCDPKQPLPFISIGSTKNHISLHHLGLYGSTSLLEWFVAEWPKYSTKKLDMGKGCVRFKKAEDVPLKLIEELAKKMTPQQWVEQYEKAFTR
jgi:hypothetical protein